MAQLQPVAIGPFHTPSPMPMTLVPAHAMFPFPKTEHRWKAVWLLYSPAGRRFWGEPGDRTRFDSFDQARAVGAREVQRVREARKHGHGQEVNDFGDWFPILVHEAAP